jgi:methyl-accepting chemotaxis protein
MKKKHRNFRIASNIKIGSKLVIGFLIVAIIAAVVGLIGMNNIRIIVAGEKELYEENTLGIEYISHAHNYYQRMRVYEFKMVLVDDADELEAYIDKINDYSEKSDEYLKLYEDGIISDIDRELFDELKPEWEEFKSLITKAIELLR